MNFMETCQDLVTKVEVKMFEIIVKCMMGTLKTGVTVVKNVMFFYHCMSLNEFHSILAQNPLCYCRGLT